MIALYQPGTARPEVVPAGARLLTTPGRRDLRLRGAEVWLDGVRASWPPHGGTVEALLELARPTVLASLHPEEQRTLVEHLLPVLHLLAAPPAAPDDRLRLDAARGAAALIVHGCARALRTGDAFPDLTDLPGAAALLAAARHRARLGPAAPEAEVYIELTDWLLGPRPVWVHREDRYDFTWEDVGLYFVGLMRSVDLAAFDWLRSGHVMLHIFSPDGMRISPAARRALEEQIAARPGPQTWEDWHDVLFPLRERLQRADNEPEGSPPQISVRLQLSADQEQALRPYRDDPELDEALHHAAAWFPEALEAGAIAPTAFRAVLRALAARWSTLAALDLEEPLAAHVRQARAELADGRLGGVRLPEEAIAVLSEVVRHRLDRVDDGLLLGRWLRRHARDGVLDELAWSRIRPVLKGFLDGCAPGEAGPWACWPAFVRATETGQAWATLGGRPLNPAEAHHALTDAISAPGVARNLARRIAEQLDRVILLHALAAEQAGPVPALQPPVRIEAGPGTHATASLVLVDGTGARWVVDSAGRLLPAEVPVFPWFTAVLGTTLVLQPRPVALPARPPMPIARETGDPVLLPDGTAWVLSALDPDGGATGTDPVTQRTRRLDVHDLATADPSAPDQPALAPATAGLIPVDPVTPAAAVALAERAWLDQALTELAGLPGDRAARLVAACLHAGCHVEALGARLALCLADGTWLVVDPSQAAVVRTIAAPPFQSRLRKLRERCDRPMFAPEG